MQSVSPTVTRRLMRELSELQANPPEGIRVVTSEENMLDVTGIIEGPEGTPYAGGYFRVKFKFTDEFPAAPPKCWFTTKIFHPNVSSAGEICVNTLKKDWKSEYGIGHILITVKCLLIYPNPESALDEEAGRLLLENYEDYCSRARIITSVHATPRVKPAEFNSPPKEDAETSKAGPSTSASSPALSLPSSASTASKPPSTSSSSSQKPLARSPSNMLSPSTSKESEKDNSKDKSRHTSPAPLGTADSNLNVGTSTAPVVAPAPTKAVKRAAPTAETKRKKALKRL